MNNEKREALLDIVNIMINIPITITKETDNYYEYTNQNGETGRRIYKSNDFMIVHAIC